MDGVVMKVEEDFSTGTHFASCVCTVYTCVHECT